MRDTCVQAHLPVIQNHIHTVASHQTVDSDTLPSHAARWSGHCSNHSAQGKKEDDAARHKQERKTLLPVGLSMKVHNL